MSSPFFTPGRNVAGQMAIPMGTHHACVSCRNSYVCDVADCTLPLGEPCPECASAAVDCPLTGPTPHSQRPQETSYIRTLRARLTHHEQMATHSLIESQREHSERLAAELRRQIALALGELEPGEENEAGEPEAEQGSLF